MSRNSAPTIGRLYTQPQSTEELESVFDCGTLNKYGRGIPSMSRNRAPTIGRPSPGVSLNFISVEK